MRFIFQGTFQDGLGRAIEGGTITVYLAGTTTLATIYSVPSGGSAVSGSAVTSDSSGKFYFYVDSNDYDATQQFKVVLSKTGYSSKAWDYLQIIHTVIESLTSYGGGMLAYDTGASVLEYLGLIISGSIDISVFGASLISQDTAASALETLGIPLGSASGDLPLFTDISIVNEDSGVGFEKEGLVYGVITQPNRGLSYQYQEGFNLSNATGNTDTDFNISGGEISLYCPNQEGGLTVKCIGNGFYKSIAASWELGAYYQGFGNPSKGCLGSGMDITADTLYQIKMIASSTSGSVDFLAIPNGETIGTYLSVIQGLGYSFDSYRTIGYIATDASANLRTFFESVNYPGANRTVLYKNPGLEADLTDVGTSEVAIDLSSVIPEGPYVDVIMNLLIGGVNPGTLLVYVHGPYVDDVSPSSSTGPLYTLGITDLNYRARRLTVQTEQADICIRANNASADIKISVLGYRCNMGENSMQFYLPS